MWGNLFESEAKDMVLTMVNSTRSKICNGYEWKFSEEGMPWTEGKRTRRAPQQKQTQKVEFAKEGQVYMYAQLVTAAPKPPSVSYVATSPIEISAKIEKSTKTQESPGTPGPQFSTKTQTRVTTPAPLLRSTTNPSPSLALLIKTGGSSPVSSPSTAEPRTKRDRAQGVVSQDHLNSQLNALSFSLTKTIDTVVEHNFKTFCYQLQSVKTLIMAQFRAHPTSIARQLLNTTNLIATSAGSLLAVSLCVELRADQYRFLAMGHDACTQYIPLQYQLDEDGEGEKGETPWYTGFYDPQDGQVHRESGDATCMSRIPVFLNNTYLLYLPKTGKFKNLNEIQEIDPFSRANPTTLDIKPNLFGETLYHLVDEVFSNEANEIAAETASHNKILQILANTKKLKNPEKVGEEIAENIIDSGLFAWLRGKFHWKDVLISIIVLYVLIMGFLTYCLGMSPLKLFCNIPAFIVQPLVERYRNRYRTQNTYMTPTRSPNREDSALSEFSTRALEHRAGATELLSRTATHLALTREPVNENTERAVVLYRTPQTAPRHSHHELGKPKVQSTQLAEKRTRIQGGPEVKTYKQVQSPYVPQPSDAGSSHRINVEVEEQCEDSRGFLNSTPKHPRLRAVATIYVQDMPVRALLDSGAEGTLIKKATLENLGIPYQLEVPTYRARSASGHPMLNAGQTHLHIRIGNKHRVQRVLICEKLDYDAIIGENFFQDVEAILTLDYKNKKLKIGKIMLDGEILDKELEGFEEEIDKEVEIEEREGFIVRIINDETLPARHQTLIRCRIDGPGDLPSLMYTPFDEIRDLGLGIARTVLPEKTPEFWLKAINPQPYPLQLTSGMEIGMAEGYERIFRIAGDELPPCENPEKQKGNKEHLEQLVTDEWLLNSPLPNPIPPHILQIELGKELTPPERDIILRVLCKYEKAFSRDRNDLGYVDVTPVKIITDCPPIKCRPYPVKPGMLPAIMDELHNLESLGIIEKSSSPWCAPVVCVAKPGGGPPRICVDYRKLNFAMVKDSYPLPKIGDILECLGKYTIFAKFDFSRGFYQCSIDAESIEKTAFSVGAGGLYHFVRMPMGLSNSPSCFQRTVNTLYGTLLFKDCVVFVDDLLVFGTSVLSLAHSLCRTLDRTVAYGMKIAVNKSAVAVIETNYLGYTISRGGLKIDSRKLIGVDKYPPPTTLKGVRQFLGFCSFFRRFIYKFAEIMAPISKLLREDEPFNWGPSQEEAMAKIKSRLLSAPVLAHVDYSKPYTLHVDGSKIALSCIVTQTYPEGERVIYFQSKTLSRAESELPASHIECLAVVYGIQSNDYLLFSTKFRVISDCECLKWLLNNVHKELRLQHISLYIQSFMPQMQIIHCKGSRNIADALSRINVEFTDEENSVEIYNAIRELRILKIKIIKKKLVNKELQDENPVQIPKPLTPPQLPTEIDMEHAQATMALIAKSPENIRAAQLNDNYFGPIFRAKLRELGDEIVEPEPRLPNIGRIEKSSDPRPNIPTFEWIKKVKHLYLIGQNGLLYYTPSSDVLRKLKNFNQKVPMLRLALPRAFVPVVTLILHGDATGGGHRSRKATIFKSKERFFWPGQVQTIKNTVASCLVCQQIKTDQRPTHAPLVPMVPRPGGGPFNECGVDHLTTLKKTERGNTAIVVFTCYRTKMIEAFPCPDVGMATFADIFIREIILRYGPPSTLHSDCSTSFLNSLVKEVCTIFKVNQTNTSGYRPESNGQTERGNQSLVRTLRALIDKDHLRWDLLVPYCVYCHRVSLNESMGDTPYALCYGTTARIPLDLAFCVPVRQYLDDVPQGTQVKYDLIDAWEISQIEQTKAQKAQKRNYDEKAVLTEYKIGQRVFRRVNRVPKDKVPKWYPKWGGKFIIIEAQPPMYTIIQEDDKKKVKKRIHFNELRPFIPPWIPPFEPEEGSLFDDTVEQKSVQKPRKHKASQPDAVQEEPGSHSDEDDNRETWMNMQDPYYAPHNPPTPPFPSRSPSPTPEPPRHKYNLRSRTRQNSQ
jgi:hypothetical protein